MKRVEYENYFWVLAWCNYYPEGGLDNVRGTFKTKEVAEDYAKGIENSYDNVEVVDIRNTSLL